MGLFSKLIDHFESARYAHLTSPVSNGVRSVNYWQDSGWVRHGDVMKGYYRTFRGSFKGEIHIVRSGHHRYFIMEPPPQLKKHEHSMCFLWRGRGRYLVHWQSQPASVDAGILRLEQILQESREQF